MLFRQLLHKTRVLGVSVHYSLYTLKWVESSVLHCAEHSVQCALCTVQCVLCSGQRAEYCTVQNTVCRTKDLAACRAVWLVTLAVMYVAAQDTGHVGPFPQDIAQTELFPLHSLQLMMKCVLVRLKIDSITQSLNVSMTEVIVPGLLITYIFWNHC